MKPQDFLRRHYWLTYFAWIAICAALFIGLRNQTDGVENRIRTEAVAARALALLSEKDSRYSGYTAVHMSFARSRIDGSPDRWIVLCDKPERSGLRSAVVVEITPDGRGLLRIRKPVV